MSDDLVKRLETWPCTGLSPECYKAALADMSLAKDRIEELEAKLAKAVALLEEYGSYLFIKAYFPDLTAEVETTLAELEETP